MSSGGAINLRLSLQGAEQVRAELDKIGPSGAKMARDLDRAMRQPGPGLTALNAGVAAGRGELESFANRSGVVGQGLQALGGWGLAAAAGVAAVGTAAGFTINRLREAMTFAADLTDTADRIGTNVENLQAWSYVADEAGVSVEAFQGNLEKLNGTLGKIKAGIGDAKLKPWLEELGITPASLETISTADDMILLLADRLGGIADRSKQVAAARAFGIEDSLPILRLGADRIRDLMEEARNLGLVLNTETIVALDQADRQIEKAAQRIESQMRFAVAGLADDFADLVTSIANALAKLNEFLDRVKEARLKNLEEGQSGSDINAVGRALGGDFTDNLPWVRNRERNPIYRQMNEMAFGTAYGPQTQPESANAGGEMRGHTGRSSGGKSQSERDADRRRQEAQREIERLDQSEVRVQREWIQAVIGRADTAASREEVARQLRELDDREFEAQLRKVEATINAADLMTDEVQARIDGLRDARADTQAAAASASSERANRERQEALRAAEDQHLQITGELLSLASSGARTSAERQGIELQLLEIAQQRQRADLEAAIAASEEGPAREKLVEALGRLTGLFDAQANEVRRRNAGPLDQWRDRQMRSAGEASEWLQGAALDAMDGLNDGLLDAYRNAESATDALDRMGKAGVSALGAIADALLKVAIQRMMIAPLTNALFGGGSGSGSSGLLGNLFGSFAGNLFGGMASPTKFPAAQKKGFGRGGVNGAAGWAPVGEYGMELMDLPVGARIHDTDATQRTLLDFDARMRSTAMSLGAQRAPTLNLPINIINRTSEPVTARTQRMPDGGLEVLLEPAVRSTVARMGADGSLSDASRLTPRPIRR